MRIKKLEIDVKKSAIHLRNGCMYLKIKEISLALYFPINFIARNVTLSM